MKRILVDDLIGHIGSPVRICGFVEAVRNQRRVQFVIVRDITGVVQVVNERTDEREALSSAIADLTIGSAISIEGELVENPHAKLGGIEIVLSSIDVVGKAESPLPIDKGSGQELRMDWRYVSLRDERTATIFKVQTAMERAMREYWERERFLEIHSPKLMGTASESGAELFKLPYFKDQTAYLAQSPQFYKQMAMSGGFDRVFEIGPVFRANPSFTSRHDTEFTSVDMEISWIESHEDVMRIEEEWLAYVIGRIAALHGDEIKKHFGVDVIVPTTPFPRITLDDARHVLARGGHDIPHKSDLDPEGERRLAQYVKESFGHEFVFVTDYPASVRAFYHMRYEDRPDVTKSFDLLWKGLEITTGAQREHRLDILKRQAVERGFHLDPLQDYLSFFRYGCPPHGGMGVGLTRLLMMILGVNNVREVTYLYRGPNRLTP